MTLTAATTYSRVSDPLPPIALRSELVDGLAEAVAAPLDPYARSTAICSLLGEVYETIEWLHGRDRENEELVSFRRVVAEARSHQGRMSEASTQEAGKE
jgi:hypothetical protein